MLRSTAPLVAILAACQSAPPPALTNSGIQTSVTHRCGDALASRLTPLDSAKPQTAWSIRARTFLLRPSFFEASPASAIPQSRSLLEPTTDDPIRAVSSLADCRIATADDAITILTESELRAADPREALELTPVRGALPDGATCELQVSESDTPCLRISIARTGDSAQVALRRDDDRTAVHVVLLEHALESNGAPLWLQVALDDERALACVISAIPGDPNDSTHVEAVAECIRDAGLAASNLSSRIAKWTTRETADRVAHHALNALADPQRRRQALLILAGEPGRLAHDLASVAPEERLTAWAETLPPEVSTAELDWALERSAIELIAQQIERGVATPSETGMLLRHFGEPGRFPSDLARVARGASDRSELDRWLRNENRRMLASSDPAARIRALDWLEGRGEEFPGYDPFGERDARRRALRKLENTDAATTGTNR